MLQKMMMTAVFTVVLMGCANRLAPSNTGHNPSKAWCEEVRYCRDGQCTMVREKMTRSECEMVGGKFSPVKRRSKGWGLF